MKLDPIRIITGKPFSDKKNRSRDLVMITSLSTSSKAGVDSAFAYSTVSLQKVKNNNIISVEKLNTLASGWMPLPGVPSPVQTRIKAYTKRLSDKQPFEDLIASIDKKLTNTSKPEEKKKLKEERAKANLNLERLDQLIKNDNDYFSLTSPITLAVSITETQKGNEFLKKVVFFRRE